MKRIISLLLLFSLCVGFTSCTGEKVCFATGNEQGTYYAFGTAITKAINNNSDFKINVHTSAGSKASLISLDKGDIDMAFVQNDIMSYAYNGSDMFSSEEKIDSFSVIGALYPEVCQIVTTKSISSVSELAGKTVSIGDAGSGVEINAEQILEVYGLTLNDIVPVNMSFQSSADALQKGTIDAFFCTAGSPTAVISQLSAATKIYIIPLDEEHIQKLCEKYHYYTEHTIVPSTYSGVDKSTKTVAINATVIASNELSEDIVYSITKAIFENKDKIEHEKAEYINAEYAVENARDVPFHKGAEKYYREIGLLY